MDKLSVNNLILEVTRRCNMECAHCLRGDAQNMDMSRKTVDVLMAQLADVGTLTMTGGEPGLALDVMTYIRKSALRHRVAIGSFYLATNGTAATEEFVVEMLRWYSLCEDNEISAVAVSQDVYHQYEDADIDLRLLEGLKFFTQKTEEGFDYNGGRYLITQGRGAEIGSGRDLEVYDINDRDDFNDGEVYVNAKGDVCSCCDLSYDNQDLHKLCDVQGLTEFYQKLEE